MWNVIHPVCYTTCYRFLDQQQTTHLSENTYSACVCVCLSRPAILSEAVHRHGTEGSARLRQQAKEGGEDEGDQRAGVSLLAVTVLQLV